MYTILAGHTQNVIKHATKESEKNFLKGSISMVEKLKSDSDNEDVVENVRRSFEWVFIYNYSILIENWSRN